MTEWPRRKRSAVDDAMLTVAGCSTYLQRQRGRENGFYDPAEFLRSRRTDRRRWDAGKLLSAAGKGICTCVASKARA